MPLVDPESDSVARKDSNWGRVTLAVVAQEAGVALSTASAALNGRSYVSRERRERVEAAALRLGYEANRVAHGLATGRTGTVCIVISGSHEYHLFDNPSFLEIIRGISERFSGEGYITALRVVGGDDEATELRSILGSGAFEGAVLVGTRLRDEELSRVIEGSRVPLVTTIRRRVSARSHSVSIDNFEAGRTAVSHLIDEGFESIGFIGAHGGLSIAEDRLAGFRAGLAAASLTSRTDWELSGDYYQKSGYSAGIQVASLVERPRALVCGNDLMALGALQAFRKLGLAVPEDFAVIGIDNISNLELLNPAVSSVGTDFWGVGSEAAEFLIGHLGSSPGGFRETVMKPVLYIRESSLWPSE